LVSLLSIAFLAVRGGDSTRKADSSGLKALGMTRAETLQNGLGLCGAKSSGSKPHADSNSYDVEVERNGS